MQFAQYAEYKPTNVEWLGDVPADWLALKLRRICKVKRGASPRPIDEPTYFDEQGEYAWVRIADVTASERYLESTTQRLSELGKSKSIPLEPGEIFLSIAATVGKPIITNIKCCIHDGFVYFDGLKFNREFLFYIFSSKQPYQGLGKLGTQLNLNTDTVADIVIPIPSKKEQAAIVDFLDAKCSELDALIAEKRRLIDLLHEKRRALISHAVTKGLNPATPTKPSGIPWLGDIPAHWDTMLVRRVCSRVTDGAHISPDTTQEDELFVSTRDLDNGNIDFSGCLRTSRESYLYMEHTGCRPFKGDVLFSKDGTVGKTAVVRTEKPFVVASSLVILTPAGKRIASGFLDYWLNNSLLQQEVELLMSGAALRRISVAKVGNLPVLVPPLAEQTAIENKLDDQCKELDQLVSEIEESTNKLQEYRTALISAAVTGKIDVRGWQAD